MGLDLSHLDEILALLGSVGAVLASIGATAWRAFGYLRSIVVAQREARDGLLALEKRLGVLATKAEKIGALTLDLRAEIGALKILAMEREKDVARLEGRLDQATRVSIEMTGAVKEASASLGALWRTLQVLHPDKVPKRASDGR